MGLKILVDIKGYVLEEKKPLIIIISFFVVFALVSWNKCGQLITYDSTREFMVPYLISKGLVLYKDIEYFYCPFVPYLLGYLMKLCGPNLGVLYGFGLVITLAYSLILYCLSRVYLDRYGSVITTSLFLVQNAFFDVGTYVFPYSYSALVGSFLVTLLIYILLLHFKSGNEKFIYIALLIISLCSITKQDYFLVSVGVLFIYILMILLKTSNKDRLKLILSRMKFEYFLILSLFPMIVYSLLIYSIGFNTLYTSLVPLKYLDTKATYMFNQSLHYYPTIDNLILFISNAFKSLFICMLIITLVYIAIRIISEIKKQYPNRYKLFMSIISVFLLLLCCLPIIESQSILIILINIFIGSSKQLYSSINFWIFALLICFFFSNNYKNNLNIIFLLLTSLIINYRMFFDLSLHIYAFFYLPTSILLFVIIWYNLLPELNNKKTIFNSLHLQYSIKTFMVLLVLFYALMDLSMFYLKKYKVKTPIGEHYAISRFEQSQYKLILKAAEFVEMNSEKKDKILAYPYIGTVYAFSGRLPLNNFYIIFPGMIYSKEFENKFINTIKNGNPKYILISKDLYDDTFFDTNINIFTSGSFKPRIVNWIKNNYTLITKYEYLRQHKSWFIEVYKHKNDVSPYINPS